MSPASPFLRLPAELRYSIYDELCISAPHSYPYKQPSPIAAINLSRPPMSLLLLNHALLEEVSNYYFSRCTFRFVAQSFSNAKNIKENICKGSLLVVRKMGKVELLLLPGTMRAALSSPGAAVATRGMSNLWLGDQIEMLRDEARELKLIIVSLRRVSWNHEWSMRDEMEALLKPLEDLKGRVEFRVGEVMGPAAVEQKMLETLGLVLQTLNK